MRKNRTVPYFEGKVNFIMSRKPYISIHELAIEAMRKQRHSDLNDFYLDCALVKLMANKQVIKKDNQNQITLLAA